MNNQEEGPKTDFQQLSPTVNLDGTRVRTIREAKGLTQLYVATAVGVTTDTISRWENRRYPTVKRENALKLAEILEVDISDILESEPEEEKAVSAPESASRGTESKGQEGNKSMPEEGVTTAPGHSRKKYILFTLLVIIMTIAASGVYFLKPRKEILEITASRYLPDHSAPGQVFPVVIDVYVKPVRQRTLLVKDGNDRGIEFLKGIPPFTSRNSHFIKWIFQGRIGYTKFIYLARISKTASTGEVFPFSGEVTIKAEKTNNIRLTGNHQICAMPYSWADINQDHIIDDEEILEAYDLLSEIKDAENTLKKVEILWSAGSYRWDRDKEKFLPVQKIGEQEKDLKKTVNLQ